MKYIIVVYNIFFFLRMAQPPDEKDEKLAFIIKLFNKGNIKCANLNDLDGLLIPREILMSREIYKQLKEDIPDLKTILSSSYLTCLQSTAEQVQKWPLLNLMRQILRSYHYKMVPKKLSNGYTPDGKKKYKRMFIIQKMII
jgi:hypothetical protein